MPEPTDRADQIDRFKEFVRSYGYELEVSDSGVSIEKLLESFDSILKRGLTRDDNGRNEDR